MHKIALFVVSLFLWQLAGQSQIIPIQEARTLPVGTEVTITGIVTNGSELGIIRYMQDSTAGIAVYPGTGSLEGFEPLRGDSITVSGILKLWNNLLEIDPITHFTIHSSNHTLPEPKTISPSQIDKSIESQLVRVEGVSFISSGNFAGSTNYNYTVNGESGTARVGSECPLVGTPIPDQMVHITGVMSLYQSTFQLLLRDEDDIEFIDFSSSPFITVLYNSKTISSRSVIYRYNESNTSLLIKNLGEVYPLEILGITLSGPSAANYTPGGFVQEIDPLDQQELIISLSAEALDGSHVCTLQLQHNGQGTNPFEVVLYSIKGNYATEPTAQAQNLNFTGVTTHGFHVSFEGAVPAAEKYIVLRRKGGEITGAPEDGTTYKIGDFIGDAQVAFIGSNILNFRATNIQAEKDYYFRVFSFNGPAGYENYLTENPLSGNVSTPESSAGDYYAGIQSTSSGLVSLLHNRINNREIVSYYDYRNTMIPHFVSRDTTDGRKVITCVYSGHQSVYTNFQWWNAGDLSREHTYAHSWMPTNPADGNYWYGIPEKPEYNDQHNLFPTHHLNANARRSNHPLGKVQNISYQFLDGKLGTDITGKTVYEPRDSHKGDAARALFYMATAYKDDFGNYFGLPANQDQELLKEWHLNDLPDNWERSRNDYIASIQMNRNPFVDSIKFACLINFHTMQYIPNPGGVCTGIVSSRGIDFTEKKLKIFPNPIRESIQLELPEDFSGEYTIQLTDVTGKIIFLRQGNAFEKGNIISMDLPHLPKGIYLVNLLISQEKFTGKIVK